MEEQVTALESATREQFKCKMWFTHRTGRITALSFKAATVTDLSMPSQSLIKRLCYPEAYKFTVAST